MENLLGTKIGALAVVFFLALLSGLLPIKLRNALFKSSRISEKYTLIILSASLCCGAGILMATVFLHILKETRGGFQSAMDKGILQETDYSLAELLICCGFFLIYLLEEVVHAWVHKKHMKSEGKAEEDDDEECCKFNRVSSINIRSSQRRNISESVGGKSCTLTCREEIDNPDHADLHQTMKSVTGAANNNYNDIEVSLRSVDITKVSVTDKRNIEKETEESFVRSFLVILALSLHGAFEGLSLGLQDNAAEVWLLCMALSAHKVFIAFSIGMEMLEEGVRINIYLIHMLIFSLASPVGGTLGITLTASLDGDHDAGIVIITILKGISGGTILYVTFCEVLERERTKPSGRFIRLFALIFGFSIMAVLQAALGEHKHGEESRISHYNTTDMDEITEHYHRH